MNKPIVAFLLLLLLGFCSLIYARHSTLLQDMGQLDRNLIPAMHYTGRNEADSSVAAMDRLLRIWSTFRAKHKAPEYTDSLWADDIIYIDNLIGDAAEIVFKEKDPALANAKLVEARSIMMEMRARNGIEYFLDDLARFGLLISEIREIAGKWKLTLSDDDIDRINLLLVRASDIWFKIESQNFDQKIFGLNDKYTERLRDFIYYERVALNDLRSAIENGAGDHTIRAKARDIYPNYLKLYILFGNFDEMFLERSTF